MIQRKKYRKKKILSGILQARERLGEGNLSSWNRCESGQLWGSGKVVQGKILGM